MTEIRKYPKLKHNDTHSEIHRMINLDFDQCYFWELISWKLFKMYKFFTSDKTVAIHEDDLESINKIKMAAKIASYLSDDKWENDGYAEHYKEFPLARMGGKNNAWTKEKSESFKKAAEKAEKIFEKKINLFCQILKEHSRNWWD